MCSLSASYYVQSPIWPVGCARWVRICARTARDRAFSVVLCPTWPLSTFVTQNKSGISTLSILDVSRLGIALAFVVGGTVAAHPVTRKTGVVSPSLCLSKMRGCVPLLARSVLFFSLSQRDTDRVSLSPKRGTLLCSEGSIDSYFELITAFSVLATVSSPRQDSMKGM